MLYQFLRDMWAVLRLRFQAPEDYRYSLPVNLAVLLLLGMVNAAASSPLLGKSEAMMVFAILMTALKCAVLSSVMGRILSRPPAPRLPLWGFVLVSEALAVPLLLILYVPQLAAAGLFWQVWIFLVQAIGLVRLSGQKAGDVAFKVVLGYLVYALAMLLAGTLLIALFVQAGWFDVQQMQQQIEQILNAPQP